METPGYQGDELALHLMVTMQKIHYCIIMKRRIYYSHLTALPSPSAMHMMLVYLGNSIFRDTTTLSKKCPLPPHIDFKKPLHQETTPRATRQKTVRSRDICKNLSLSTPRNQTSKWKSTSMPRIPTQKEGVKM